MIRALVAEASTGTRRLLLEILRADPEIVVVGEASDGAGAVAMTEQIRPDVIVMDAELPVLNGFGATKQIMIERPTPIVIVSAVPNVHHADLSVLALRAGALAILPKPTAPFSGIDQEERQRFVTTVKAMSQVKVVRHWPAREPINRHQTAVGGMLQPRSKVIAIAASTGGPAAIQGLLSQLPAEFPAPILLVQHIATGFIEGFASWLNTVCSVRVKIAEDGEPLTARTVYIAPDDHHLGISPKRTILISNAPPIGGFRPSATFTFESVAQASGRAAVAIVLTGMGRDGVDGLQAVRQRGGKVIAQDEATSVVFGMPAAAIADGYADAVLPLPAIAPRLLQMVQKESE